YRQRSEIDAVGLHRQREVAIGVVDKGARDAAVGVGLDEFAQSVVLVELLPLAAGVSAVGALAGELTKGVVAGLELVAIDIAAVAAANQALVKDLAVHRVVVADAAFAERCAIGGAAGVQRAREVADCIALETSEVLQCIGLAGQTPRRVVAETGDLVIGFT